MASAARKHSEAEARRDADHESFLAHKNFRWLKIALLLTTAAYCIGNVWLLLG